MPSSCCCFLLLCESHRLLGLQRACRTLRLQAALECQSSTHLRRAYLSACPPLILCCCKLAWSGTFAAFVSMHKVGWGAVLDLSPAGYPFLGAYQVMTVLHPAKNTTLFGYVVVEGVMDVVVIVEVAAAAPLKTFKLQTRGCCTSLSPLIQVARLTVTCQCRPSMLPLRLHGT